MSKVAIDLPIDIKLPVSKLDRNLEEIEEDLEDIDDEIELEKDDLIDDSDEDPDLEDDPDKTGKARGTKKRASQTMSLKNI